MVEKKFGHPYIPNSVPEIKEEMLHELGVKDANELYAEMIPERLLLNKPLNLPKPLRAEHDLRRHMEKKLTKNKTCKEYLNFLGAGCWQHYIPAVCTEIARRSEFLTAYSGDGYADLGRYQAFFEFQSLMGELVGMEVVGFPTYDWGTAAANAIRMASRLTGRHEILVPMTISPNRFSIIYNYCQPPEMAGHIALKFVNYESTTGMLDLADLKRKISDKTAGIYIETPSYLGLIEEQGAEISEIARDKESEYIVGVDPISLGVLTPPAEYGADLVCGDIQPLGIPMFCGGGLGGFIASRDEEKYVSEYPLRLYSITETENGDEYAFGQCRSDRTVYIGRDMAKDYIGTSAALFAIITAVYLSLMGPKGMKELGETIIQNSNFAAKLLSEIEQVKIPFSGFFKEFVVSFEGTQKSVEEINKALLTQDIFGGKDITAEFPKLGNSALYCVTEIHSKEDLETLATTLEAVIK